MEILDNKIDDIKIPVITTIEYQGEEYQFDVVVIDDVHNTYREIEKFVCISDNASDLDEDDLEEIKDFFTCEFEI
jgi:hypothetical protein